MKKGKEKRNIVASANLISNYERVIVVSDMSMNEKHIRFLEMIKPTYLKDVIANKHDKDDLLKLSKMSCTSIPSPFL